MIYHTFFLGRDLCESTSSMHDICTYLQRRRPWRINTDVLLSRRSGSVRCVARCFPHLASMWQGIGPPNTKRCSEHQVRAQSTTYWMSLRNLSPQHASTQARQQRRKEHGKYVISQPRSTRFVLIHRIVSEAGGGEAGVVLEGAIPVGTGGHVDACFKY